MGETKLHKLGWEGKRKVDLEELEEVGEYDQKSLYEILKELIKCILINSNSASKKKKKRMKKRKPSCSWPLKTHQNGPVSWGCLSGIDCSLVPDLDSPKLGIQILMSRYPFSSPLVIAARVAEAL